MQITVKTPKGVGDLKIPLTLAIKIQSMNFAILGFRFAFSLCFLPPFQNSNAYYMLIYVGNIDLVIFI